MLNSTAPFDVVRVSDPAIDRSDEAAIDWSAFFQDRDTKHLRYYVGEQPVVYHCRVLSQAERREVMGLRERGESTYESRERAFAFGLIKVTRHTRSDGGIGDWIRPQDSTGGKARALGDAGLGQFGTNTIDEIGGVVEARSFLDRDQPLLCPLLPTSQLALTAAGLHHAARMKRSAASSVLSSPLPEAAPPRTQSDSPDGAASGDATATANPI